MKNRKLIAILVLLCAFSSNLALARSHGGFHHRGGFYFGTPFFGYRYGYPYFPPTVVIEPPLPITYIQQPALYPPGYWYYCSEPSGYYPTISSCPRQWQQVAPLPAKP